MDPNFSYSVFSDESGTGDRFLAIGGILLPTSNLALVERRLEEYCSTRGFIGREMAWKKAGKTKLERYCEFVDLLWQLIREIPPIDFRAIVINKSKYPLAYDNDTEEEGFYRFYHFFLTRSITIAASHASSFQLHIAMTPDRYSYHSEILQKTVGGTIGKLRGRTWQIVEILRGKPKQYRVHQLADVLLGAVSSRINERKPDSHKQEIIDRIEARVGQRLDRDFMPHEQPFNVWFFTRTGERRWAPGSGGRVG